jgi:hypothetical protein
VARLPGLPRGADVVRRLRSDALSNPGRFRERQIHPELALPKVSVTGEVVYPADATTAIQRPIGEAGPA